MVRANALKFVPIFLLALGIAGNASPSASPRPKVISTIDLAKPFGTRSQWQFTALQGPDVDDLFAGSPPSEQDKLPGVVTLCLHTAGSAACAGSLSGDLDLNGSNPYFAPSHYLRKAEIVRPRTGKGPLFLVQTANLPSGDGDIGVLTQIVAYDRGKDRFGLIYRHVVGSNNNGEVRYIAAGPLKGDVVEAEQTSDLHAGYFGYWVTVRKLTPAFEYRQVLKYRSATHYGDGNPLAVIDSEMPNIERRLGVWQVGQPLPLPAAGCAQPRLERSELWCARPAKP